MSHPYVRKLDHRVACQDLIVEHSNYSPVYCTEALPHPRLVVDYVLLYHSFFPPPYSSFPLIVITRATHPKPPRRTAPIGITSALYCSAVPSNYAHCTSAQLKCLKAGKHRAVTGMRCNNFQVGATSAVREKNGHDSLTLVRGTEIEGAWDGTGDLVWITAAAAGFPVSYTLVYMCMPRAWGCARDFNRICALTILGFLDWLMAFAQVGVPCS